MRPELRTAVEGDEVVIRIPIMTLAFAAEERWWLEREIDFRVGRSFVDHVPTFAAEVRRELEREDEDGSNALTRLFDDAIDRAMEEGCDGVNCDGDASLAAEKHGAVVVPRNPNGSLATQPNAEDMHRGAM